MKINGWLLGWALSWFSGVLGYWYGVQTTQDEYKRIMVEEMRHQANEGARRAAREWAEPIDLPAAGPISAEQSRVKPFCQE